MKNVNDKIRGGINFKCRDYIISETLRDVNHNIFYNIKTQLWHRVQGTRVGNWQLLGVLMKNNKI